MKFCSNCRKRLEFQHGDLYETVNWCDVCKQDVKVIEVKHGH